MIWKDGQRRELLNTYSVPGVRETKNVFKSEDERAHSHLHPLSILRHPTLRTYEEHYPKIYNNQPKRLLAYLVITGGIEVCGWPTRLYPVILCFLLSFNSFVF